jgi:hypothetical protein
MELCRTHHRVNARGLGEDQVTLVADRQSMASGATNELTPRPELLIVHDAQQFYLSGVHASPTTWSYSHVVPGHVYYIESQSGRLGRLLMNVAEELTRLGQLRPGWDRRRGRPITPEAIFGAAWVLGSVLDSSSEAPQFFPLPGGGIQIEWYADDQIEIEIDEVGQAHVLATSANGDVLAEGAFDPQVPSELAATTAALVKSLSAQVAAERRRT